MSVFNGMAKGVYEKISAKTAAYQILPDDLGTLFTNRGASGSVTFTLPDSGDIQTGWNCRFFTVANQTIVVAAASGDADTMVTFNDAAADSISYATAGEIIGVGLELVWDGTGWLVFISANEAVTPTIVTA